MYARRLTLYQLEEWQRARAFITAIVTAFTLYQLEEWQRARAYRLSFSRPARMYQLDEWLRARVCFDWKNGSHQLSKRSVRFPALQAGYLLE